MSDDKKPFNWMKFALIVSVGLNLLIATAVGSAIYKNASGKDKPSMRGFGQIEMMMRALPEDKRRELRRNFLREIRAEDGRKQSDALRTAIADAMFADPYDEAALQAALEAHREFRASIAERSEAIWLETFGELTPDERDAFELRLKEQIKRGKKRK